MVEFRRTKEGARFLWASRYLMVTAGFLGLLAGVSMTVGVPLDVVIAALAISLGLGFLGVEIRWDASDRADRDEA